MHLPELIRFALDYAQIFVLTGAGISTSSGIPGYRDPEGNWQRRPPVTHQEFVRSEATRKRYWARSLGGWPAIRDAIPNVAHDAMVTLQRLGHVTRLVTQNVDGLHQRAGSTEVIDLHGRLDRVICLDCGALEPRAQLQAAMQRANPAFAARSDRLAPDGDAELADDCTDFIVPSCPRCGGTLKPDVVFFGDNVPRSRVQAAFDALEEADAMLVVGSSLMTYSGYRFCERARDLGRPIAAINRGRTRADDLFALKIDADCVPALSLLVAGLMRPSAAAYALTA